MKTILDPHHPLDIEWGYKDGKFYHRNLPSKTWVEMKRMHITTKRILALSELITENQK